VDLHRRMLFCCVLFWPSALITNAQQRNSDAFKSEKDATADLLDLIFGVDL